MFDRQTMSDAADAGPPPATVTVWHGFTDEREIAAFDAALRRFERQHPGVRIEPESGCSDEMIIGAILDGRPPDVASSGMTAFVGVYAASGLWVDLTARMRHDGIDEDTFVPAAAAGTSFAGRRPALPLGLDAYALYLNRSLLDGRRPPATMTELLELAKATTVFRADGGIEVAGFVPSVRFHEHTPQHLAAQFGAVWLGPGGRIDLAGDPGLRDFLGWQRALVDFYGHDRLDAFLGETADGPHPFHSGRTAAVVDGPWRLRRLAQDAPGLDVEVAPMPVGDRRPDLAGSSPTSASIGGIPIGAKSPDLGWELLKFLALDSGSARTFADDMGNLPATRSALRAMGEKGGPALRTFAALAAHERSAGTPTTIAARSYLPRLAEFVAARWEPGLVDDLTAALAVLDQDNAADYAGAAARLGEPLS